MKNSVVDIKHCYGCGVCAISCSHNAIEMQLDKLGFYQPIVSKKKCTNCGACRNNCAYIDDNLFIDKHTPYEWFAGWSKDERIVESCSSGGVAYELTRKAIEEGYKVIGVRYNSKVNRAEHVVCETIEDLEQIKGSKYLPSYTVDAFKQIKKGEKWLVIGTPCQVDSLRRYVRRRRLEDDVIFVDFFCHGVPSYNMWKMNLSQFFSKIQIQSMKFRTKRNSKTNEVIPWHKSYVLTAHDNLNLCYQPSLDGHTNWFYHYFLNNLCLGEQCYRKCKYKMYCSSADIRLGDAWSTVYNNNERGVSTVLIFSNKGTNFISMIKTFDKEDIELNKLCDGQMSTLPSSPRWYKLRLFMMRLPKLRFGHIEKFIYILNKLLGSKNEEKGRTDNNA